MLAADLLQVGAVFTEADLGSDMQGDTFEVTFAGGAPGTQLTQLIIDGDMEEAGFGEGDVIFDTEASGLGADNAFPFTLVSLDTAQAGASVTATVQDGSTRLVIDLEEFYAGDRLIFSVDVDEVEDFDLSVNDLVLINDGIDPITSGVEFQGSILTAHFEAPHFHDAMGSGEFRNRYDDALHASGLDLPADDETGQRDRTDAAFAELQQIPIPVSISGTVYLDHDLDLEQDPGDRGLGTVELSLWKKDGETYQPTGHTAITDGAGDYEFGFDLNLMPGVYQVREVQPDGLFSVGAVNGTVAGASAGRVIQDMPNLLTDINIPLGGQQAIDFDFAEARPASISGQVYHDRSNDGFRQPGEEGIAGVLIDVIPTSTVAPQQTVRLVTDADGAYSVTGLSPGSYRVVEVEQPAGFFDGLDRAGTVGGQVRGSAVNPGDRLEDIQLLGGDAGIEYNFGEIAPASLSGRVHLADEDGNCFGSVGSHAPLAGATIQLRDSSGDLVAVTTTDANGEYRFDQLRPGTYTLTEVTPPDLLDGSERAGTVDGEVRGQVSGNDVISSIVLRPGEQGVRFDFCEHEPASISGHVYHDASNDGRFDPSEEGIASVEVALLDAAGNVVATQTTSSAGFYRFDGLYAGNYQLRETHPAGWIDGLDTAGSIAGQTVGSASNPGDSIRDIRLRPGDDGVDYDFGELAPTKIGGFVYHDRDNDGVQDSGEEGIAGVTLRVIPVDTLAPQEAVTVQSDADGMYMAGMLSPGVYRIVEVDQPSEYLDGLDTPGSVNGQPRGQAENPGDSIETILLESGEVGVNYNFGEVLPANIGGRVHLSDEAGDCFGADSSHLPLPRVDILLLDSEGNTIAQTVTDRNGEYTFQDLLPGTYTVRELTPVGLLDGGEMAGTIDGRTVGRVTANDTIEGITVGAGQHARNYDFCEHEPAVISGYVYHDLNDDGAFALTESPISDVRVALYDAQGQVVAEQLTDANGFYEFQNLMPGEYSLAEEQPAGWIDGTDSVGFVGGENRGVAENPGDRLAGIMLRGGERGVQYNFGELLPVSISGIVHADLDGDCLHDPGEAGIADVVIDLLNADGDVIATTVTDQGGRYTFAELRPGTYSIRETQPRDFFHGGQQAGSGSGAVVATDLLSVQLLSGENVVDYNFCELPPSRLSGFVFQDGPAILTPDGVAPSNIAELRDGRRTSDDAPISGVVLELRGGLSGERIMSDQALDGYYAPGAIQTVTDASGFYEFPGLPGNSSYAVYEVHPDGYLDGIDTAGTTSGLAINPNDMVSEFIINRLVTSPRDDAIILIPLGVGQVSAENNFSEVLVEVEPTIAPPPARVVPPSFFPEAATPPLLNPTTFGFPQVAAADPIPLYGGNAGFTWHLSVVDAGMPRGVESADTVDVMVWHQATYLDVTRWQSEMLRGGEWYVVTGDDLRDEEDLRLIQFGITEGIPVVGDFNGDGLDEVGIYINGEWFIDLNGNGKWDESDLWAKLGGEADRPVTGDWDGDGKDDIGIFGPQWPNDARAIEVEPGLPDALNLPKQQPKNPPPKREDAAEGHRLMKLRANGPRRADLIDHVFRFGAPRDVPITADMDGDGIVSIGVFRDGQWKLDTNGDGRIGPHDTTASFGREGDLPVVGDFDGDGIQEIGVYRMGVWHIDSNRNLEMDAHDRVFEMGDSADRPVVGDWDGDGADEPGVYHDTADGSAVSDAS